MLALMLALAWVPLMSHCKLESIPGLAFFHCASDNQTPAKVPGHCGSPSCCAIESGQYQLPSHQTIIPVFGLGLLSFDIVADCEPSFPPQITLSLLTAAPPELSTAWQFTLRTAPPCRAPSVVS